MGVPYSRSLYNEDLAPTTPEQRTWGAYHIASLWIGMAVCIPTYMLASTMIRDGLSWIEAMLLILGGNAIVLVPMVLNSHAGTKYGIPFPVLARASFGTTGAHIPSVIRAVVACGWFGIQCWIGGQALDTLLAVIAPAWQTAGPMTAVLPVLGLELHTFLAWIAFWAANMYFVWKGTESIKVLEAWAAPLLIVIGLALLGWGANRGGGLAHVLAQSQSLGERAVSAYEVAGGGWELTFHPIKDAAGQPKARFVQVGDGKSPDGRDLLRGDEPAPWIAYAPTLALEDDLARAGTVLVRFDDDRDDAAGRTSSIQTVTLDAAAQRIAESSRTTLYLMGLTAMAGFWATLALNIPDITRYARSQRDQALGQLIGLPGTMLLYSFIGVAVTCATVVIFDDIVLPEDAIWDPIQLLARFDSPALLLVSMFSLAIATLTTNLAANIISPANSFSNAFPERIDFRTGGMIAGALGLAMMPWKLLGHYVGWLVTYSGFLGPVLGVLLADYYLIRGGRISVDDLYLEHGCYRYHRGVNPVAVAAVLAGIIVVALGLIVPALAFLYHGAWFSGLIVAAAVYRIGMALVAGSTGPA